MNECPHCKGELVVAPDYVKWQYECQRCRRVWIILDELYWLAGFDAGGHIYKISKKGNIEEIRQINPLWEKLWDRVRGE